MLLAVFLLLQVLWESADLCSALVSAGWVYAIPPFNRQKFSQCSGCFEIIHVHLYAGYFKIQKVFRKVLKVFSQIENS
jgi:hypothetical protein